MQPIGHHFLGKRAVGREELRPDIEELDQRIAGDLLRDNGVGLGVHLWLGVFVVGAAGENGQQQDLRIQGATSREPDGRTARCLFP